MTLTATDFKTSNNLKVCTCCALCLFGEKSKRAWGPKKRGTRGIQYVASDIWLNRHRLRPKTWFWFCIKKRFTTNESRDFHLFWILLVRPIQFISRNQTFQDFANIAKGLS
jgi:hypothetical protein